jgi:hypothetical protein
MRIFLEGEDFYGDHGQGSLVELRLRPLLILHIHKGQVVALEKKNYVGCFLSVCSYEST